MSFNDDAGVDKTFLKKRTFDELQIGEAASLVRIVERDDIDLAAVSGEPPARGRALTQIVRLGMGTSSLRAIKGDLRHNTTQDLARFAKPQHGARHRSAKEPVTSGKARSRERQLKERQIDHAHV